MSRCLQLSLAGLGHAAPNPLVGAVLVHGGRIIGEGFHRHCGGPHAEVECLASVAQEDRHLIPASTLYVSLEPCDHHGRTPPCTGRILREGITEVVVACRDPNPAVDGRGIGRLQAAGVRVTEGVLEREAAHLNRRFLAFHRRRRPYIVLKWAESADGNISAADRQPVRISHPHTDRLVHRWRAEEQAVMVGTGTLLADDPRLTCRLPGGRHPIRIVIDRHARLPSTMNVFGEGGRTLVFNTEREEDAGHVRHLRLEDRPDLLPQLLGRLYDLQVQSVLVEGGARLIAAFLHLGCWDEIRRITAPSVRIPGGYPAPRPVDATLRDTVKVGDDRIDTYIPAT